MLKIEKNYINVFVFRMNVEYKFTNHIEKLWVFRIYRPYMKYICLRNVYTDVVSFYLKEVIHLRGKIRSLSYDNFSENT